jgi:hypothetical protein
MKLIAIIKAIIITAPWLHNATSTYYAKLVNESADLFHVPPLLLVAIIEHESRWNPNAVNTKSGACGLGQVLPYNGKCILGVRSNIRASAGILHKNYVYCSTRGNYKISLWEKGLAGYQTGRCKPVKMTKTVLNRWQELERRVR